MDGATGGLRFAMTGLVLCEVEGRIVSLRFDAGRSMRAACDGTINSIF